MAYKINQAVFQSIMDNMRKSAKVFAPCLMKGHGMFSDTDIVAYNSIDEVGQIIFDQKSMYSFKETILPISETLFYFTDDDMTVPKKQYEQAVVFLRNCDLHGLKRFDDIYRSDGKHDLYYERLRHHVTFIVMGCKEGFESCFCQSMGTDKPTDCDGYIETDGADYILDCKSSKLRTFLTDLNLTDIPFEPTPISNTLKVDVPEEIPHSILTSPIWDEYDARCIACGRCNFVCPTCTCFTMQDIFYEDNKNVGERRRVWASCQVNGFTDIAGNISFRKKNGERMRFKVLHKISDHKKRYGEHMCVGCGRCDDICPEYISFTAAIEKVKCAGKEEQNG